MPIMKRIGKTPTEYIAVMGMTGVGKTSFINLASGSKLSTNDGLRSVTDKVEMSEPFEIDGRQVVLVDTPSFDDTVIDPNDILGMIAAYLKVSHDAGTRLTGVMYMHRISDVRVPRSAQLYARIFRKLCGTKNLDHVTVVTTRWDEVDKKTGEEREKLLFTYPDCFKPLVDGGASIARNDRTPETAKDIIRKMLKKNPVVLQLQDELKDVKTPLSATEAGAELDAELRAQTEDYDKEHRELERERDKVPVSNTKERRKLDGKQFWVMGEVLGFRGQAESLKRPIKPSFLQRWHEFFRWAFRAE